MQLAFATSKPENTIDGKMFLCFYSYCIFTLHFFNIFHCKTL